jgi:tetratricopeptide (TPR) repeat protein
VVARALGDLSQANRQMGLYQEGIQMAKEALEILERLGKTGSQGRCMEGLAWLYLEDGQLDAAEETASRALNLFSKKGDQYWICGAHRLLGVIYHSKGETEKAIRHFEVALGSAYSSDSRNQLYRIHFRLVWLFLDEDRLEKAQAHVEHAKSYALNHSYHLADVTGLQAELWYRQGRFEEARSEGLRAADAYERLGAAKDLKGCRRLLQKIERKITKPVIKD